MNKFQVLFFESDNRECPVEDFIKTLDPKMRAKMVSLLEILEERGNELREPYSKHIDDGIFELRCQIGNNISRILYFFYYQGRIVLTNGFIKKTQKLPAKELSLAKERRNEYLERMCNS